MDQHGVWAAYLTGAFLTLVWKWSRWCWQEMKKSGPPVSTATRIRIATLQWIFEPSASNAVSWVTTFGIVWVFGVVYISGVSWTWFAWVREIPVHVAIAFLLGSLMEMIAPAIVKTIASRVPYSEALTSYLKGGK